ncbi:MAG: hypothetical protein NVS4B13_03030 [Candidatus Elarobacter sp.]
MDERRSPGQPVVIAVFALLLLAPALLALTGHGGFDVAFIVRAEQRRPFVAPPPTTGALATGGWERDAERQIADAFPLRTNLIEAYHRAKNSWLHDIDSRHVMHGRDGWLFLGNEERWYVTGDHRPGDADLAALAGIYAERAAWCARHGIAYVVLIAPNKSTIYSGELPVGTRLFTPTPADRLFPLLRARGVRAVDVRSALIAAASKGEVYSKGDTHWNDAGAYVAYRATVAVLRDAGVRDAIVPSSFVPRVDTGEGDLLNLAGIAGLVQNRIVRYDFPHRARPAATPSYPNDRAAAGFMREAEAVADPSLPVAVVFGDSFSEGLRPFLAEDFRRTVVLRHMNVTDVQFDAGVLLTEKPAVVIQELAERSLIRAADFRR